MRTATSLSDKKLHIGHNSFKLIFVRIFINIGDGVQDFDEAVLRKIDLNLLVVFAMVMRHRSVQAAAARLYLGPSGVSMALARLRELTGDPLFNRSRLGLQPTEYAEVLIEAVAPALSVIASALTPSDFDPQVSSGTLRIALSDDIEIVLLSRLRKALAHRAPAMELVARHADYSRVSEVLQDNHADLVVTAHPTALDPRLVVEELYTERFLALTDGNRTEALDLETYVRKPHALVSARGVRTGLVDDALRRLGRSRSVRVATESFAALPYLIGGSDLVATLPATAATLIARQFGLKLHTLPFESPSFQVTLAWRSRDDVVSAQVWLRNMVKDEMLAAVRTARRISTSSA
ncbi:LysR family transcriptional regulator [Asticcacaulis sp. DXS10W]|uniref:LysR family transcriptional regulator n=1 Tax=Asticcacaulis currens TaxID=2984210 RepID=A0ABT5IDF1_9CAUL|nr:LysR family transcriptional regulator [Asticcacaulis currens]MDC7694230.1 LysR family transcriptional regulator [Asticcacaulis currens]